MVVAVVTAFLVAAVRRRRADLDGNVDTRPVRWGDRFVVIGGMVVPGGILAGTFVFSLVVLQDLTDLRGSGRSTWRWWATTGGGGSAIRTARS